MKKLIFYNYFHNGDIHISREFVKDIINKINPISKEYHHHNSKKLLFDIDIEILDTFIVDDVKLDNSKLFYETDSNLYVNTWFHLNYGYKYYGCSIEALYFNFTEIYKGLGIELEKIDFYLPKINFDKFDMKNIDDFFLNHKFNKYVYISNGPVLSNQSDKMDLNIFIEILSKRYPDCLFILSENTNLKGENIMLSSEIIGSNGREDLVENSYLTTKCDIIVGRNSGPSTFSMITDNILTEKKQDIIHMSNTCLLIDEHYFNKNKTLHKVNDSSYMVDTISKIIG